MARSMSLRARIFVPLAALVLVSLAGAAATAWYAARMQTTFTELLERDVEAIIAAEEMLGALVAQNGFLMDYFVTGDPAWLEHLAANEKAFEAGLTKGRLAESRSGVAASRGRSLINSMEAEYVRYAAERSQVTGTQHQFGAPLQWDMHDRFSRIYAQGQEYKALHKDNIARIQKNQRRRVTLMNSLAWAAAPGVMLMGLSLFLVLQRQVLDPIRKLANSVALAEGGTPSRAVRNEVADLSERVRELITDVDKVQTQLRESREVLAQSGKLAVVGKLAAGVAHSIRNPLTSVKMRLYTLERTLSLDEAEKEDFEVISEEIRHIDSIVRSFLEFSRPPKLKVRPVSLSDVVDSTLALLGHKFESYHVDVLVKRETRLPEIMADPEQIKEALVNLLLNSCEAMGVGGTITISEEEGHIAPHGRVVLLRISDTGPGVPDSVGKRIFEPFFSTKEEGSGLGVPIAARIMQEHGGWVHLASNTGRGANFVIGVPAKESDKWLRF